MPKNLTANLKLNDIAVRKHHKKMLERINLVYSSNDEDAMNSLYIDLLSSRIDIEDIMEYYEKMILGLENMVKIPIPLEVSGIPINKKAFRELFIGQIRLLKNHLIRLKFVDRSFKREERLRR